MSKIDQIQTPASPAEAQKAPKPQKGAPGAFADALATAAGNIESSGQTAPPAQPPEQPGPVGTVQTTSAPGPEKKRHMDATGQALDLLERYAEMASDPARSLKELEPMVRELTTAAKALQEAAGSINADDGLKGIMQDVAALAEAEGVKFQRGDYI